MKNLIQLMLTGLMLMVMANCGGGGSSISTLATTDAFDENDLDFNPQMDILWVVDPSKSMFEEVEKVRNNVSAFIEGFITLGYQYRMGVITTSAWSEEAYLDPGTDGPTNLPFLRDGSDVPVFARLHKGQCVDRTGSVANPEFLNHLTAANVGDFLGFFSEYFDVYGIGLGVSGCGLVGPPFGTFASVTNNFFEDANGYDTNERSRLGDYINDERHLQSVRAFLESAAGASFVRPNAHLAIIIVSDEPDASRDSFVPNSTFAPGTPGNHTAQMYLDYLDAKKSGRANYSIYSIVDTTLPSNIARDIAVPSGGLFFDINATQEEYVENLNEISNAILSSASFFPIAYPPIQSTIEIVITRQNGLIVNVPRDIGAGGFTYNPTLQGVTISAGYLPARGDTFQINYIPSVLISGVSNQPRIALSNSSVPENSAPGVIVGTVSLKFRDATGGVYAITADTSVNGFQIDPVTGVLSVLTTAALDSEAQSRHDVTVSLTLPDTTVFDSTFLISIADVPDSVPVAVDDNYIVSESVVDGLGVITVTGNLTYNDDGVDGSETHTYALSGSNPSLGTLVINANGTFTYSVAANLLNGGAGLDAGDSEPILFDYSLTDTSNPPSIGSVTITINGSNQSPVLFLAIPPQVVNYIGGLIPIPLEAGDITVSGTAVGTADQIIDTFGTPGFQTSSASSHFVKVEFPGSDAYEVDRFEVVSDGSLGNSIFQVLAPDGTSVITREVIPVSQGSTLTVDMGQKVIGRGVRILRPVGAKNSANHSNLRINEVTVYGILAQNFTVNLLNHFDDADIPSGDTLTFYATDEFGEGPAPSWLSVVGNTITGTPPASANVNVGVIAQDESGATAFTVFNIQRTGTGSGAPNGPPIALLPLQDEKRGGITIKRFGGGSANANPQLDNQIVWGEIDNFFVDPYAGQPIRDAFTNSGLCTGGVGTCQLTTAGFRTNPASIPDPIENLLPVNQRIHFGDAYSPENGWSSTPVYTDNKYPSAASDTYCSQSAYLTPGNGGKITPCLNPTRSYGETYSGYFVPAETGVYRFRTRSIDDNIRLFVAPTEYLEDLIPVVTVSYCVASMVTMTQSVAPGLNTTTTCSSEFRGVAGGPTGNNLGSAVGSNTGIFFIGDVTSYKDGYVNLRKGNVYALELRFGEGGGDVAFEFEYDRKDQSCMPNTPTSPCWDGFKALDASVLVPAEGSDAHVPQVIPALAGVNLSVAGLFYDAEQDSLEYTARLVNPNGTPFVGPGATSTVAEIGLSLNAITGLMVGNLNANYTSANPKPRVIFTATERFTPAQAATSSLPIKFDPAL